MGWNNQVNNRGGFNKRGRGATTPTGRGRGVSKNQRGGGFNNRGNSQIQSRGSFNNKPNFNKSNSFQKNASPGSKNNSFSNKGKEFAKKSKKDDSDDEDEEDDEVDSENEKATDSDEASLDEDSLRELLKKGEYEKDSDESDEEEETTQKPNKKVKANEKQKMVIENTAKNSKVKLNNGPSVHVENGVKNVQSLPKIVDKSKKSEPSIDKPKTCSLTSEQQDQVLKQIHSRLEKLHSRSLYMRPISKLTTPAMLKELAKDMQSCRIPQLAKNFKNRYGFLEFKNKALAEKCMKEIKGKLIANKPLFVKPATSSITKLNSISNFNLKSLSIYSISKDATEADMKQLFTGCQTVSFPLTVSKDPSGFATIVFTDEKLAFKYFNERDETIVKGVPITVIFTPDLVEKTKDKKDVKSTDSSSNALSTPKQKIVANKILNESNKTQTPKVNEISLVKNDVQSGKKRKRELSDSEMESKQPGAKQKKIESFDLKKLDSDDDSDGSFDDEKLKSLMEGADSDDDEDDDDENDDDDDDDDEEEDDEDSDDE